MMEVAKKILNSMINMRNADNRFAPLKIVFSIYLAWLIAYAMLGDYLSQVVQLYYMSDDVLLVQHSALLFLLNPGLAGVFVVFVGVGIMHLLVFLKLASYTWLSNALIITGAFIALIIFLLVGLWAKVLADKAIESGEYIVCPYGPDGYSRKSDYGGSDVYRLALLNKDSGTECR
ncbi:MULTISPECIES: hypothetical protein [Pseudomonas]|uniref:DUF1240 domain-containing protein n=1 Tax=Pseudomonas fulva TaxID=47880 RepID=A0A0D0KIR6_9PSED|nr:MULTISPECIES: hypothetical protein [Pseudomonas]KIP97949.1 hypothetical protein RU08_17325 [Pseudomonas fulva]